MFYYYVQGLLVELLNRAFTLKTGSTGLDYNFWTYIHVVRPLGGKV